MRMRACRRKYTRIFSARGRKDNTSIATSETIIGRGVFLRIIPNSSRKRSTATRKALLLHRYEQRPGSDPGLLLSQPRQQNQVDLFFTAGSFSMAALLIFVTRIPRSGM